MSVHLVLQSRRLEMRLGNVALFGAVLFCLLWTEEVQAGSSFLSPADMQKNAGKKTQKRLMYKANNRRDLDGEEDLSEEQSNVGVTIPMDISVKMTLEQFQKQKAAIQDFLYTLLSPGQSQDTQEERGQSDDQ
ncbi:appetite-regulating hormone isoform X1 [Hyperolius riggenbachi]|uniref:appetite-regulating hormone isoform X1 n=2 Tax=Hyperolius riggenbachi TaxID=752182 RepID=UPI0035A32398